MNEWIWQWNESLIQVYPSVANSKEECEAWSFKWLRRADASDEEAKEIFKQGKAVKVGDFEV